MRLRLNLGSSCRACYVATRMTSQSLFITLPRLHRGAGKREIMVWRASNGKIKVLKPSFRPSRCRWSSKAYKSIRVNTYCARQGLRR